MENTPIIRFKGFTDAWEQRKLGDNIVEYHEVTTVNNQYPPLTSSRKGIFLQTEYFSGNQIASADNTGYNIVPYGYFTYRHMSDDEIFYFNINDIVENGIVSTLYPVFTTDENLDSRYLQYQLNYGHEFAKYAVLQKQGGSRTYMYLSKLKQLSLTMPKTVDEQKKISGFFMELDNLITLHQRKCDETKNLKKYMLTKMFPKNGEIVPEIRFEGFSDAWEQRKLGDVVEEFYNGQTPYRQNKSYWDGNISWLSSGDLNRGIVTSTMEKITEKGRNASRLRVVPKGTFVMAVMGLEAAGTRGNCGILGIDTTINQACMALIVDEKRLSSSFLFQWYRCFGDYYALKYCQGTKQQNYNAELLSDLDIDYPSIEEQAVISQYFENLDNLITLHQRKCDELKEMKKYMFRNMFV